MPGKNLCLLSFDGGGVRGQSSLQILKQLMDTISPDSPPKPCDYFDMIGGTSTGSILAIMLGRLQMAIDDCIDAYIRLSDRAFVKKRHRVSIKGRIQRRFDSGELERAIKKVVAEQGLREDALLDCPDSSCKVFVCATSKETGDIVRIRSYRSPRRRSRTIKIWEAARATCVALSFFDPITIGPVQEGFVDGATGAKNPIYEVWNEARDMWPAHSFEDQIQRLIYIGTATDRYVESQAVFRQVRACGELLAKRELIKQGWRPQTLTEDETRCRQTLWPKGIDYESQRNQNPKRVPGTCFWALKNSRYTEWRNNDTTRLLWIPADPGCGKSVLTRCIIDEDLPQASPNNPSKSVLYYFFKDASSEQRSATRAISAMLHQLFISQLQLIRHALPSYREIGEAFSTAFLKLWSILIAATMDLVAGEVICIFDALDECNEQDQRMLFGALEDFCIHQRTSLSRSHLKFLITSRPYLAIRDGFFPILEEFSNIELAGNDETESIKKEIDLVIKSRVADLARRIRLHEKVQQYLQERLLGMQQRTYLWLRLLWETFPKEWPGTISGMNSLIDRLPTDIYGAYETLL